MLRDKITHYLASSDHQLQTRKESHCQSHEQITHASADLLISEYRWRHPCHREARVLLQSRACPTQVLFTQLGCIFGLAGSAERGQCGDTRLCWKCQARHRGDEFRFGGPGSLWLRDACWTHSGRFLCQLSQHTDDKVLRFHRAACL